jgi:lipopolysaccharide transport system permease protein
VLCAAVGHFAVALLVLVLLLALIGHSPGIYLLAVPVPVLLVCLIAISLGIVLGVLNVFFRDIGQLFATVLQAWFWLTPVVYPLSALPPAVIPWVGANPLTPVMDAMQRIVLGSGWPHWGTLGGPLITGLALAALALLLFRRRAGEIVDEL